MTPYAQKLLDKRAAAPALPNLARASVAGRTACSVPAALARFGPWMRIKDVAECLGVSVSQVSSYRDSGALEFINISAGQVEGIGADWRISRDSVAAFLQKRQSKTAP